MKYLLFLAVLFLCFSCNQPVQDTDPLSQLISEHDSLRQIIEDPSHRVQIIYTQIDRNEENQPSFKTFTYQLDTNTYFYPASTVKLPAAVLALEKLNELNIPELNAQSTLLTSAATPPQTAVMYDSSSANYLPSIAHYIKKIFLVSDNDAYNRLFEFLGQLYFNQKLIEKGYTRSRIIHRLSVSGFDTLGNRLSNPIQLLNGSEVLYQQEEKYGNAYPNWTLKDQIQGKAYTQGDELIEEPFDFTYKNYFSLHDFHDIIQSVMLPDAVPAKHRFNLTESDYALLYEYMSKLPRESDYPAYPDLVDWDDYVKFLLYGSSKKHIPDHIRIYNKVGDAYGYLTDAAYIVDFKNKVEF
ncbi:MAG: serine hydrolase, partial [Bacteroidota bacterium]